MTDGPFKNLKLSNRWKRFAAAAHNDAVDIAERSAIASDALLHEILTDNTQALLVDLQTYTGRAQLDLDPMSSVEGIFNNHSKTPFSDTLQKELVFRLNQQIATDIAIQQAVKASVEDHASKASSRIEEECIDARESGKMHRDQSRRTLAHSRATFDALATKDICDALWAGDKNAFKNAAAKRKGLDEGPRL